MLMFRDMILAQYGSKSTWPAQLFDASPKAISIISNMKHYKKGGKCLKGSPPSLLLLLLLMPILV